jgi:hypothetical protein
MKLLDLPVEIIDQILDLTLPSGFESFVLSCKAVYARAGAQIQRHNTLKQQWRLTTFTNRYRDNMFHILYDISRNELGGQYIEVLGFLDCDEDFQLSDEAMQQIKTTILEPELLGIMGVGATEWWEAITADHESGGLHAIISLLSQLPNLRTLQLPSGWYDSWYGTAGPSTDDWDSEERFVAALDAIIQASNNDESQRRPLGKLKFILPTEDVAHDDRASFQCLEPFMRLKSLSELYATNCVACDDGYTGLPFQWRFPDTNSSLTRVELT